MAQFITLDKLKKLASKPIVEKEGSRLFSQFAKSYESQKADVIAKHSNAPRQKVLQQTYVRMRDGFLKQHCPPIRYISAGSSRTAFALDGGFCLKVASTEAGIGQNKAEAENSKLASGLGIFPELHQRTDGFEAILVDCVSPCADHPESYKDLQDAIGQKFLPTESREDSSFPRCAGEVLGFIIESLPGDLDAILESITDDPHEPSDWRQIASLMLSPQNEAQKVLRKLAEYVIKSPSKIDPVDFCYIENWGLAVRNGKLAPVVLDAGFSPEVKSKWYS